MTDDVPEASPDPGPITLLLHAARRGDRSAEAALASAVYAELRTMAAARLRGGADTVEPTALVHEAWAKLGPAQREFDDRRHFFGAAARAMRQALVDRHRHRHRHKRDLRRVDQLDHVELDALAATVDAPDVDLPALDDALTALDRTDARMAEIVHLRFFAGLSVDETADALGISPRTVKREWNVARAWLHHRMTGGERPAG